MKFSELTKKIESWACNSADEANPNAIREIEEKYLGDIHGGLNESSPHGGFNKNIQWKLAF